MHSIYKGTITHTRYSPQKHKFRYSTSMLFIDLENINKAFDKNIFWSYNKRNLATFNESDYYVKDNKKILTSIKLLIKNEISVNLKGKIYLLTNAKYFGYCFTSNWP